MPLRRLRSQIDTWFITLSDNVAFHASISHFESHNLSTGFARTMYLELSNTTLW